MEVDSAWNRHNESTEDVAMKFNPITCIRLLLYYTKKHYTE